MLLSVSAIEARRAPSKRVGVVEEEVVSPIIDLERECLRFSSVGAAVGVAVRRRGRAAVENELHGKTWDGNPGTARCCQPIGLAASRALPNAWSS